MGKTLQIDRNVSYTYINFLQIFHPKDKQEILKPLPRSAPLHLPPPATAHCSLPTAHCPLSTVHCPLPTAHCPLPTAHCPLPTAHCPLPTASPSPTPYRSSSPFLVLCPPLSFFLPFRQFFHFVFNRIQLSN